jgi:hypothetical protein
MTEQQAAEMLGHLETIRYWVAFIAGLISARYLVGMIWK